MNDVIVSREGATAVVELNRGKVNALNEALVRELADAFRGLKHDPGADSIVLTGRGRFFSFGFDIPEFMNSSKEEFTRFVTVFTDLYQELFGYPKPVVAALNGHAVAGGCMLATACDYRIMVDAKAKIALNEIGFGSTVLAGSVYMLQACVGFRNAEKILTGGSLYAARDAMALGLVDQVEDVDVFSEAWKRIAQDFAGKNNAAFHGIKQLMRGPVIERMKKDEPESIRRFVDIWYSKSVRENLKQIKIQGS